MIGWITLDVGEQALIYSLDGSVRIEDGPQRLFLWREKCKRLSRFSANQQEYLVISHKNGHIDHVQGPFVTFLNPTVHSTIHVEKMVSLDANEALVVYRCDENNQTVKCYITYGPTQFMLGANEWLHEFSWHGTDPKNKTRMIPGGLKFQKLKIIPDQFYYNVEEVRTSDDAVIKIKLMVFYELTNTEKMLSTTSDPFADFINCLTADVVAFTAKRTYLEFIEQSGDLNELNNYPDLMSRSKSIGYDVSKVVFRGYVANGKLQELHDSAIDTRTKLKINYEKEEQEQSLTDLKLENEMVRMQQEQTMDLQELQHKQKMEGVQLKHKLKMDGKDHADRLEKLKIDNEAKLNAKTASDKLELEYLDQLHVLGVDLTQYLNSRSARPDKITQIVAGNTGANLHLHHQ